MKKKIMLLTVMMMAFVSLSTVHVSANTISNSSVIQQSLNLQVRVIDPTNPLPNPHRNPVEIPEVWLNGRTLTFDSSCHNCELRLVNEDNEVEYTTVITSDTLVLPATLEGQYEIQIIRDNWCFYGDINL